MAKTPLAPRTVPILEVWAAREWDGGLEERAGGAEKIVRAHRAAPLDFADDEGGTEAERPEKAHQIGEEAFQGDASGVGDVT